LPRFQVFGFLAVQPLTAMGKIKITCQHCGHSFACPARYRGNQISCPKCKQLVPALRGRRRILLITILLFLVLIISAFGWLLWPVDIHWPDRRPIGVLLLASDGHTSAINPRGWFNDEKLDVLNPGGQERFRKALFDYENNSIAILKRVGAQGVIIWDLEGQEFPHKTTYIGDPRVLNNFAPEMAPVANEFFKRLRDAGLQVGVTIRPQQLTYTHGLPQQSTVLDIKRVLLEKIDYAHTNWGATIFYIDSNDGFWRPDEAWQLRLLARERPDILLIPEHHYLPYWAFSAPYVSLYRGRPDMTAGLAKKLYPQSFKALYIADASSDQINIAWHPGDILLFRAWFWNDDCKIAQQFSRELP
jgi:hypothetical protein